MRLGAMWMIDVLNLCTRNNYGSEKTIIKSNLRDTGSQEAEPGNAVCLTENNAEG